jgi:Ca2+/Na+ antiporter
MGISNSIGSNTFDILICLGLPWLIRGLMISNAPVNFIQINSGGLEYSTILLIVSLILLYTILACNRFVLDKKVGIISLSMYASFLVISSLFELNVFFDVNQPTCQSDS